jgi:hypothetical protein
MGLNPDMIYLVHDVKVQFEVARIPTSLVQCHEVLLVVELVVKLISMPGGQAVLTLWRPQSRLRVQAGSG